MHRKKLLALILLAYGLITIGYGVANPLFEAPDEHSHYFTAQYIAENGRLPVVEEQYDEWMGQEAAQPPLYYLIGAPIVALIDTNDAREQVWLNPFASIGDASALNNLNWVVHTTAEAWPWSGWALAAHLLRLLSTLFGAGTLLAIYGAGRLLWPGDDVKPLLATALVAFLPQFAFIHATVTNDSLITLLCSLALYQLLRLWRRYADGGADPTPAQLLLLGLTIGAAALTKTAGILLLIYSIGFLGVLAWVYARPRFLRAFALMALPVGLMAVAVAGWLWWRNFTLYGDPTAANQFIRLAGGDRNATILEVLGETDGLLTSLVAIFGWFNLRAPNWVYWVWGAIGSLAALGGLGCLILAQDDKQQRPRVARAPLPGWLLGAMLAGWPLLVYAGLFSFMLRTEAAQGRLLFPAILPIALGVAWGLLGHDGYSRRGIQGLLRRAAAPIALAALATTVYCLLFVIRPAYAVPPITVGVSAGATPVLPQLVDRGQGLSLPAAEIETTEVKPGDPAWMTLYWRADAPPEATPELVMEVFGREQARIANFHGYHGRGQYPATLWPTGAIVTDRFALRIDERTQAPVLGRVFARLAAGEPGIEIGRVKIVPERWPAPPTTLLAELGDHIGLANVTISPAAARPGDTLRIDTRWYVPRGAPGKDYTTLVHLGQPDRTPLATGDAPPLAGMYPTGVWAVGETIDDDYRLTIPPLVQSGRYPVWIGMYDPITGQRLPVTINGVAQPNNIYLAGWVEIDCAPGEPDCSE